MSRALLVVACLLCLSLPAAAVAGPGALDDGAPTATEPTQVSGGPTPMLQVSPPATQSYGGTGFDPGVAFSLDRTSLQGTFDRYRHAAVIENASTDAERRIAVENALTELRERLTLLREQERSAIQAYAAGTIDSVAFRQRIAAVDASARALQNTTQSILPVSRNIGEDTFERANTLSQGAAALTGPVRTVLAAGLRSGDGSEDVYATVTEDGVVLARIQSSGGDLTYVREGVRLDNRDADQSTTFASAAEFYDFMAERYPDATSGPPSLSIEFPGSIHRFDVRYGGGTLTAYVDGSSRGVFRDVHTLRVSDLSVSESANATSDGLSLRVNQTFQTGPLEVTTLNEDGEAVAADLTVANRSVQATGDDGTLWTVAPDGTYTVTATRDGDSVSVTVG